MTVPPKSSSADEAEDSRFLEVKHVVPGDAILAAKVQSGETYRVCLTDRGLGTVWYMFGALEDVEGMKFELWKEEEEEDETDVIDDEYLDEWEKEERRGPWFRGENADKLLLVIEMGEVKFDVA